MTILSTNKCRICGCSEENPCIWNDAGGDQQTCAWFDSSRTLCTNPRCIAVVPLAELEEIFEVEWMAYYEQVKQVSQIGEQR